MVIINNKIKSCIKILENSGYESIPLYGEADFLCFGKDCDAETEVDINNEEIIFTLKTKINPKKLSGFMETYNL